MRALLQTIDASMPYTGSRGGALCVKDGKILPEIEECSDMITVTRLCVELEKPCPIPNSEEWFEKVWRQYES